MADPGLPFFLYLLLALIHQCQDGPNVMADPGLSVFFTCGTFALPTCPAHDMP